MLYPEFIKYQEENPESFHVARHYKNDLGDDFYVEPGFYTGLLGFKEKREDAFPKIMEELDKIVQKHHHVYFAADFENPFLELKGYVYKEISDLSDPLEIFVEDKNRTSDYGD